MILQMTEPGIEPRALTHQPVFFSQLLSLYIKTLEKSEQRAHRKSEDDVKEAVRL